MIPEKLEQFINNEKSVSFKNYDLTAISSVLEKLGNPQNRIRSIHIAGTNGKGSVAHMLNHLLLVNGYSVGLYTSPHLLKLNERILVDNQQITDQQMEDYIDRVLELINELAVIPTFFDVITIIAFLNFYESSVDYAVIETGLGGRLDSTNVIIPKCSIITSISNDHTHILGDNLADIAAEKAGIIKPGVPVISTSQVTVVTQVLEKTAKQKEALFYQLGKDFWIGNISPSGYGLKFNYRAELPRRQIIPDQPILLPVASEFQADNAALALTAYNLLHKCGNTTNNTHVYNFDELRIPGRLEILSLDPYVIFDPSHNVQAVAALCKTISRLYRDYSITIVLSLMQDKDVNAIFDVLSAYSLSVIYIDLPIARQYKPVDKPLPDNMIFVNDLGQLKNMIFQRDTQRQLFLFTGSFTLYGVARALLGTA